MMAAGPYQRVILIHYHEIGLKGHNRSKFESRLMKNVLGLIGGYPVVTIHKPSPSAPSRWQPGALTRISP